MAIQVPFFRPDIREPEIDEVVASLRSGWLTTGPRVKRFEEEFAAAVGAPHAVAVNSATAALHLAVEALGLKAGEAVLVPTMTFAATAEIVRYLGAHPILVDCDPVTTNLDLDDARCKLEALRAGKLSARIPADAKPVGIIPVHIGGLMMDVERIRAFAHENGLWVVEDAAHAFPASWRKDSSSPWQRCGENTSAISCFSFYANKTITTGEGGMATTTDAELAHRMRLMSLHGLSHDAWGRYSGGGKWDYRILAPGFKYNLTDLAAAIGIHQLARAEAMRREREAVARELLDALDDVEELELPPTDENRIHSWHLFPIRLRLERLSVDRNQVMDELKARGVGCSVHWRPLHLHPYYEETFGWRADALPVATHTWERLVSLPVFPGMRPTEIRHVVETVKDLCRANRPTVSPAAAARS
ncbi:MAG TPA: DegT/DnrJ/EryC1/StrS family aminotransferase [Thermoanaerobaculia bacterium]|nr:DegT/DnrJ/EryC1/StrS family aminotransferase [Thermoanaerobaculia bacterium]